MGRVQAGMGTQKRHLVCPTEEPGEASRGREDGVFEEIRRAFPRAGQREILRDREKHI